MGCPKTVDELEAALFAAFPREDAESWDRPGLAVGDRSQEIAKVAVDLDMSAAAVIAAAEAGCNVLVTHHPPYLGEGPDEFGPFGQASTLGPGRMVFAAARRGVSAIAMHTNADRSVELRERFARLLGENYECMGNFEHLIDSSRGPADTGFGALFDVATLNTTKLGILASHCAEAFSCVPRVWGDPDRRVGKFAVLNGSWNPAEVHAACVEEGVECIVVGETKYHGCVDVQPELSVIDLGHDKSELPIVDMLGETIAGFGIEQERIVRIQSSASNWWTAR